MSYFASVRTKSHENRVKTGENDMKCPLMGGVGQASQ
jgi:hypothetical protein